MSFVFASVTGVTALRAYADLGYRGHTYKGKAEVFLPRDRRVMGCSNEINSRALTAMPSTPSCAPSATI
jgi:hypothetical protein